MKFGSTWFMCRKQLTKWANILSALLKISKSTEFFDYYWYCALFLISRDKLLTLWLFNKFKRLFRGHRFDSIDISRNDGHIPWRLFRNINFQTVSTTNGKINVSISASRIVSGLLDDYFLKVTKLYSKNN